MLESSSTTQSAAPILKDDELIRGCASLMVSSGTCFRRDFRVSGSAPNKTCPKSCNRKGLEPFPLCSMIRKAARINNNTTVELVRGGENRRAIIRDNSRGLLEKQMKGDCQKRIVPRQVANIKLKESFPSILQLLRRSLIRYV